MTAAGGSVQGLQLALAHAAAASLVGEQWATATRRFIDAGGLTFSTNRFVDASGRHGSVRGHREVSAAWAALREGMSEPGGAGAWLSAELDLSSDGRFSFSFNWDRRPYMNPFADLVDESGRSFGPGDEDWLRDLALHPRSLDRAPDWLAALTVGPSGGGAR